ncbi:MAG: ribonuclease J [Symbiobacteriaceae bacterium]|nr:ribonuclease J [Symbiobacteriaceae bacterium]
MSKKANSVQIIPLGGVGEIGKNILAIRYGQEIIVIDAGLKFPDDSLLGIDYVLAKTDYLKANARYLKALILTHAHEDHIGGVPYLLKDIPLPIYASNLTLGLLEPKLKEHQVTATLQAVRHGQVVAIGRNFKVEFIHNNHSIPDSFALAITTPAGVIFHTGDFKIDQTPIEEATMDLQHLAAIGSRGVLAMICDSTNAERDGFTKSERIVGQTFDRIFSEHTRDRIIIATFASNIYRVQQVLTTAEDHHRQVAAVGRSMVNNIEIAASLGYLKMPPGTFISIEEAGRLPNHAQVILSTGSQGEPLSGLVRMANQSHSWINIGEGDLVIFSSSPIPGNETLINKVINGLYRNGAKVIHQGNADVHVSGHANSEDIKLMLALIKPRYLLPFHGEYRHQAALLRLVQNVGITSERCYLAEIGDVLELSAESMRKVGKVEAGILLVDGLSVGDIGNAVLRERRAMGQDGVVTVVVAINKKMRQPVGSIEIISRGFIYMKESEELIDDIRQIVQGVLAECRQIGRLHSEPIKEMLQDALGNFLYDKTGRRPVIIPLVVEV